MPERAGRNAEELFKAVGFRPRLVTFSNWTIMHVCSTLHHFLGETKKTRDLAQTIFSTAEELCAQKKTERLKDILRVALLALDCYYAEKKAGTDANYYNSALSIAYYLKRHLREGEGATGIRDERPADIYQKNNEPQVSLEVRAHHIGGCYAVDAFLLPAARARDDFLQHPRLDSMDEARADRCPLLNILMSKPRFLSFYFEHRYISAVFFLLFFRCSISLLLNDDC